jgi:hypothetical protein
VDDGHCAFIDKLAEIRPCSSQKNPFPYSDFLRGPNKVLPRLDEGDVLLERRDEENLVLTSFRRFASRQRG